MSAHFRPLGLAVLMFVAACGSKVADSGVGCPAPSPGLCAPSLVCNDGFIRTGEASCVSGAWICGQSACGGDAGVDGATDASTDAGCPPPNPGMCIPTTVCTGGFVRTGGALCTDGAWVCEQTPCTADGGVDGAVDTGCSGEWIDTCDAGHKSSFCCPAGASCVAPQPFCDLGAGACSLGACADAGCSKGAISTAHYDQACVENIDCVLVYEGSACGICFCPNAAISSAAEAKYRADWSALDPPVSTCSCTLMPAPVCRSGICSAK